MKKEVREVLRIRFKLAAWNMHEKSEVLQRHAENLKYIGQLFMIGGKPSIEKDKQDWPDKNLLHEDQS